MSRLAVLFPGQGSLTAQAAEETRQLWPELTELAGEMLGEDPFARASETTACAQPATFVASMARWREAGIGAAEPAACAGHSLGEFAALAAAGVFSVEDALELVVLRGRLMAAAAALHPGGMVAVLGGEPEAVTTLIDRCGLTVANDNAPGQIVASGPSDALTGLIARAREDGLRAIDLGVAGGFHSPAMDDVVGPLREAIAATPQRDPGTIVVSAASGRQFVDIAAELAAAVVRPVRWRDVMARLVDLGVDRFRDIGPGVVLERLAKRNLEALGAPA